MRYLSIHVALLVALCLSQPQKAAAAGPQPESEARKLKLAKEKIKHVIVIYQENWSFDGLYGHFPNTENLTAAPHIIQVDGSGHPLDSLPRPMGDQGMKAPDMRFNADSLPNRPYDLTMYGFMTSDTTGDLTHRFYTEQRQIDGGKMDKFVWYGQNQGLTMSDFDASDLPEGKLAKKFTICDHFFHSGFGGSFFNHIFLIAAQPIRWQSPPSTWVTVMPTSDPTPYSNHYDNTIDTDGHTAINTCYSVNWPYPIYGDDPKGPGRINTQFDTTIGDRLTAKGKTWAWYAGGWDDAVRNRADNLFEYHHEPFMYFDNYKKEIDSTYGSRKGEVKHLKDINDFKKDIDSGHLPAVSFLKNQGEDDEHPNYTSVLRGQKVVDSIVHMVMDNPKYWESTVIIITYDEHGGRWDHVPPPHNSYDRWGPGTRVPAIVISPYSIGGHVDSTQYETVSILRFIESLYDLQPLTERDKHAANLVNALEFK